MKGDKGTCSTIFPGIFINRTKFDTKKHAQETYDFYVTMGFVSSSYVVYKCKTCGFYHFGKQEWAEMLGK